MSRRPRDVQQSIPHNNNKTSSNHNNAPPLLPPPSFIPTVGMIPTIINHNNNSATPSNNNGNNLQRQNQQVQNFLKLSSSVFDFNNFDLASLGDGELCSFFSQAIDTIDSPLFLPLQPTHSRFTSSLVRCLGTMPWGRIFSVATIPANLPVETGSKSSGGDREKEKEKNNNNKEHQKQAAGTFLFRLPSSNRARAYPTSMHDLHAFAKTTRRQISALFALLAIKLANFSPSSIPDILSATLQYFSHLPPAAEISMNLWFSLPPALSTSEGSQQQQQQQQNVPSSSAPSSCRAYASALTTWLDNEIDTHIFRIVGSLLARYEEYQSQGSISRANLSMQQNAHINGFSCGDSNNNNNFGENNSNVIYTGLLRVCMTVLENSVPKKRWPVVAHHLSWFSVMGKFFQSREVEAMAKALGELEFSQNTKYSAIPASLVFNTNNINTPTTPASSNATAPSPRTSGVLISNNNNNNNTNSTYSTSGPASSIAHRAQSTLSDESFSCKILQLMLNGLVNLETLAKQSRENSYGARRCAAIVVDSLISVGFLKVQQRQQQQSKKGNTMNDDCTNNNGKKKNNNNQSSFPLQSIASPHQQQHQQRNTTTINSRNSYFGRPSSLFAFSLDVDVLFSVVLQHYLQNVIVMSNQSVCCAHAVVVCAALGLDYVTIPIPDEENNEDAADDQDDDEEEEEKENQISCTQSLVLACLNRLGKSFLTCVHLDLFVAEQSNTNSKNNNNTASAHDTSDSANSTRNPPTAGNLIASDIHTELLALSHLAACLKSLFTLADQSPEFLKTEVFEKRCFRFLSTSSANKRIIKALTDLAEMLISQTKSKSVKNSNNPTKNSAVAQSEISNSSVANWLLSEILKPFSKIFGFSSTSSQLSNLLKSIHSNNHSKDSGTPRKSIDESEEENNNQQESDGEAAIDRFFNHRKKLNQSSKSKDNIHHAVDANAKRFEIIRAPEVSIKIWRSYSSFMKELLPFTTK